MNRHRLITTARLISLAAHLVIIAVWALDPTALRPGIFRSIAVLAVLNLYHLHVHTRSPQR